MPKTKNQGKNKSRFEVRGGLLNEFEFALNEGEMTEEERDPFAYQEEEHRLDEAEAAQGPQTEAERIERMMEDARREAARRLERPNQPTVSGAHPARARKSAKKSGAGKGAKKGTKKASKRAASKRSAGKASKRPSSAKKGAARKSSGGKSAGRKSGKAVARKR